MTKVRDYKIEILMSLLMFFVLIIAYYAHVQNMLVLESNRLLTENAVRVRIDDGGSPQLESLEGTNYRIFVILHENIETNSRIYAFHTSMPGSWRPPMSEGTFFEENDTREAVVGRHVILEETANGYIYIFNEQAYEVIGFLGLTTPSLLDETVILNTSYYKLHASELVVDSDNSGALTNVFEGESNHQVRGVLRLLEVDFFTPLILRYSQLISILTIVVIGYLYFLKTKEENMTRHLIGEGRISIFNRNIFYLCLKWLLFTLPFLVLTKIGFWQNVQIITQWILLSLALVASYGLIYFITSRVRGSDL